MNLLVVGCRTLWRELSFAASQSPHHVRLELVEPEHVAGGVVQDLLDDLCPGYDAVVVAMGTCALPIAVAPDLDCPVILPRIHDCAGLLLGSRERHRHIFDRFEGACHWHLDEAGCERLNPPCARPDALINLRSPVRALPLSGDIDELAQSAEVAYREYHTDLALIHNLLCGLWADDDCAMVRPGQLAEPSFGRDILRVRAAASAK